MFRMWNCSIVEKIPYFHLRSSLFIVLLLSFWFSSGSFLLVILVPYIGNLTFSPWNSVMGGIGTEKFSIGQNYTKSAVKSKNRHHVKVCVLYDEMYLLSYLCQLVSWKLRQKVCFLFKHIPSDIIVFLDCGQNALLEGHSSQLNVKRALTYYNMVIGQKW